MSFDIFDMLKSQNFQSKCRRVFGGIRTKRVSTNRVSLFIFITYKTKLEFTLGFKMSIIAETKKKLVQYYSCFEMKILKNAKIDNLCHKILACSPKIGPNSGYFNFSLIGGETFWRVLGKLPCFFLSGLNLAIL